MIPPAYEVTVIFDSVKGRYVVVDSTIEGLKCEASSAAEMIGKIMVDAAAILGVEAVEVRTNFPGTGPKAGRLASNTESPEQAITVEENV
jgi:hypothetical protein